MTNALKKEKEPVRVTSFQANKWTEINSKIRMACNKWTDEEISLYQCVGLSSWESR